MTHVDLQEFLSGALAALPAGALLVGCSGGMDSCVLLHALAQSPAARTRGLRAIHVDHGVHADSAQWASQCREFAAALGVALDVVKVQVDLHAGYGPEDAARRVRHAALREALGGGEILALAQHRDDQAETILLKLLRGAGPEGLGGMRERRRFGAGWLWRPLLALPRGVLADYARQHALRWIEDPSNADTRLRRNFLRAQILPQLTQRWPDASAALAHSATWARHAADWIDTQAVQALASLRGLDAATLSWRAWLDLPPALRDPVLRLWLRDLGLDEAAHFHVQELERQLRAAAVDRNPCVRWDDTELRRYRDLLYAQRPLAPPPPDWQVSWNGAELALADGGMLALDGAAAPAEDGLLSVRYRRGGERLKPAGTTHTRELRLLLQEAGVPPWRRAHVPLIFAGAECIAAGDLVVSDAALALCARLGAQIRWRPIDSVMRLR